MNDVIVRLTASAKSLSIDLESDTFMDALEVASLTFEDGRGPEMAFEMGRSVLVVASTSNGPVRALTAA